METNLKDFLAKVDSLTPDKLSCNILSCDKNIKLEPLNIKQQKDLIKQTVSGVKSVVRFTKVSNSVVLDSSGEEDLLVCDKAPILIELRKDSIGSVHKGIDLNEITQKYKTHKRQFKLEDSIVHKNFTINVFIPTIKYDNTLLSNIENLLKEGDNNTPDNLDVVYTYEIARFVKSIEVDGVVVDFTTTSFKDKSTIFERLPLSINKLIIDFIEQYRKEEKEILTTDKGTVDIDVDFFDLE
jgi:hypothetical protein